MSGAIKINGTSSGSTTITAPASGGDESIELSTALAAKLDASAYKPGLALLNAGATTFTSTTSVSVNNVFDSTYTAYEILWSATTASGADMFYRNRVAGADATTNYYAQQIEGSASATSAQRWSAASNILAVYSPGSTGGWFRMTVIDPAAAAATKLLHTYGRDGTTPVVGSITGYHSTATAYDGFTIYASANMTGTVLVFGISES